MFSEIISKILHLKKQKNAIILAHNYMRPEIFEVADAVGDSFELSKSAQEMKGDIIVFAGVHFMAESAKLLNPSKKVLLPSLAAGCFMADTITAEGLLRLKKKYPNAPVVVYMNTSAEVKALSTATCTSSNALKIVESFAEDTIIFAPDKHLCEFVQDRTHKKLIPWAGFCHVHTQLSPAFLQKTKEKYPGAHVLLHPESPKRLFPFAEHICGTGGMSQYIQNHPEVDTFLIGTEEGMVGRLKRDFPEKTFVALMGTCINMKQITLDNIFRSLSQEKYEITIRDEIFVPAQKSLEEMMKRS